MKAPVYSSPMSDTQTFLESKKARALLIALVNCDLVFLASIFLKADPAICSALITATLALAGIYIGGQSAVDGINAARNQA